VLWIELEHFESIISRIHNYIQIVRFLKLQKIKWQVITKVNVAHLVTEVSFINMIAEHICAFFQSWHEFKNSVAAEIRLLFLWPFRDDNFLLSDYCGIGHSPVLLQWPKLHLSMFCSKSEMVRPWFVAWFLLWQNFWTHAKIRHMHHCALR